MKYCKKHNLEYNDYLKECPICFGETLDPKTSYYRKSNQKKKLKLARKKINKAKE